MMHQSQLPFFGSSALSRPKLNLESLKDVVAYIRSNAQLLKALEALLSAAEADLLHQADSAQDLLMNAAYMSLSEKILKIIGEKLECINDPAGTDRVTQPSKSKR